MKSKISRALRYTIGFAITGLLVTFLVIYVQRSTLATYEKNLPYLSLGDNVKNRSTQAHLWFEELMAGDESLNFERDVMPLFITSKEILEGAYMGQNTELGDFEKIDEVTTLSILKKSIEQINALSNAAQARYDNRQKMLEQAQTDSAMALSQSFAGEEAGGVLDQKFDESYEQFQATMTQLVSHISSEVKRDSAFLKNLSWISTALIIGAFAVLCGLVYRLQSGNDAMVVENKERFEYEAKRMTSLSAFIEQVSAGNYSTQLSGIDDSDHLSSILTNMRDKLGKNAEADFRRSWSTTGLAQIGGILRANYNSSSELYDNVIKFVVKYMECNQGGLFVLEGEGADQYLELVACYAYERKKFVTKRINVGEGLVGQCYVEGQKIYLLDVPHEYTSITSGLGGSNPTAILLIPMKINDKIYGVIELASFKRFQDFEIELVEKLTESIAAAISTVRINESTRLLLEKTQQQAEELRAQEEEMRQNLEELEATQEEIARRQTENENVIKAIDSSFAVVEFDLRATVLKANQNFLDLMGYSLNEIKGRHHRLFVDTTTSYSKEYEEFWRTLTSGVEVKGEFMRINKRGEVIWISGNYTPMLDKNGQVVKIMKMATDITNTKQREQQYSDYILKLTGKPMQFSNENPAKQVVEHLEGQKGKIVHKKMEFANPQEVVESNQQNNKPV
jgi:PAS domain S-box-containing protein